jgi:hypothetical protein
LAKARKRKFRSAFGQERPSSQANRFTVLVPPLEVTITGLHAADDCRVYDIDDTAVRPSQRDENV